MISCECCRHYLKEGDVEYCGWFDILINDFYRKTIEKVDGEQCRYYYPRVAE